MEEERDCVWVRDFVHRERLLSLKFFGGFEFLEGLKFENVEV